MAKEKKVILFIVEGISDKEALEAILDKISNNEVAFYVVNGDLTSEYGTSSSNVKTKITEQIKQFMKQQQIQKKSISKVIHLVDTDGSYIDDMYVLEDKNINGDNFIYSLNDIRVSCKEKAIKRNIQKKEILNMLVTTQVVFSGIAYEIYYFSMNLDHVLHNDINLSKELKVKKAQEFQDFYIENPDGFIEFINLVGIDKDYIESWEFIKEDRNSLHRHTNLNVCIKNSLI